MGPPELSAFLGDFIWPWLNYSIITISRIMQCEQIMAISAMVEYSYRIHFQGETPSRSGATI